MWQMLLQIIQSQPKIKGAIEQMTGQPVEYVAQCAGTFLDHIGKGPGLTNTNEQKFALFNRVYRGGLALGFSDWESELCAAKIAGYADVEICISFCDRHKWPGTTVDKIQALAEQIMPRFVEKAKVAGLLPPEMFPQSGLPQTEIVSTGGVAPWESLVDSGASGKADTTAPKN